MKSVEDRILESETSRAHLERRCDVLNEVVIEQGKMIHRLQAQMRHLTDTMEREEMEQIRSNITKPPHSQL
jgi:uncharacterized coiled-coil protein SlyX